jgi:hypothetical protein
VQQLHAANLIATYDRLSTDKTKLAALKHRSAVAAPAKPVGKAKSTRIEKKPAKSKDKPVKPKKSLSKSAKK